jgi:hypothetical protein
MLAGCTAALGSEWVADRHRWHAERRWQEAKHKYRQAHPQFATQELEDLFEEFRRDWDTRHTPWGYGTIVLRRDGAQSVSCVPPPGLRRRTDD